MNFLFRSNYFFQQKKQLEKKDNSLEKKIKEVEILKKEMEEIKIDLKNHLDEVLPSIFFCRR